VEKVPNDPATLNNLAYLLCEEPATAAEAVSLSRKAVDIAEKSAMSSALRASLLQTQGVCLLRTRDYVKAEEVFRQAIGLEPSSIDARVGLAEAALEQGRPEEARQLFRILDDGSARTISPSVQERINGLRSRVKKP
jgi:uncharacterized protein HemY